MAVRTTNIQPTSARNALDYPSTDVGTLCRCDKVNPWSYRKPLDYNSANIPNSIRDTMSGFRIDAYDKLYYQKPTTARRLDDFRGYEHNSRYPQNLTIYHEAFEVSPNYQWGQPDEPVSFGIPLPNTQVVKLWKNESHLLADVVSIYDSDGMIMFSAEETDFQDDLGRYLCRYYLDPYTESYFRVWALIALNLSQTATNMNFSKTLQIWYGNSRQEDYKRFQIPGGDTVLINGKVVPVGVNVIASVLPLSNFPPLTCDNPTTAITYSYNSSTGIITISSIQFRGQMTTETNPTYRSYFEHGQGWNIQYSIYDSAWNLITPWTDLTSAVEGTTNVSDNTYTATARIDGGLQISGLAQGYRVNIQINPGELFTT